MAGEGRRKGEWQEEEEGVTGGGRGSGRRGEEEGGVVGGVSEQKV